MDSTVRVIKRYQNRKLYDTLRSSYVTLEEIAKIMRDGEKIKVVDNKTKQDITYMTQVQLLFERERKFAKATDVDVLTRAIRSKNGTLSTYIRELESRVGDEFATDTPITDLLQTTEENSVNLSETVLN